MERARRDEQNMVRFDRPVFGRYRGAFNERQQIALYAFAAHVRPAHALAAAANLVDLVDEHDAVLLDGKLRFLEHAVLIQKLVGFFLQQQGVALAHLHAARFCAPAERLREHVAEVDHAHLAALEAGHVHHRHLHCRRVGDLQLDFAIGELTFAKHLSKLLFRVGRGVGADERFENAFFGGKFGTRFDFLAQPLASHLDGDFQQVANDLLDIAPDIADFGELGRFDLDERRLGKLGKAPGDLGLAAACGPDHQDVLGQDFVAKLGWQLQTPPAVAQRDGDGPLGGVLADNVAVEFGDDFAGREGGLGHSSSIVRLRLV